MNQEREVVWQQRLWTWVQTWLHVPVPTTTDQSEAKGAVVGPSKGLYRGDDPVVIAVDQLENFSKMAVRIAITESNAFALASVSQRPQRHNIALASPEDCVQIRCREPADVAAVAVAPGKGVEGKVQLGEESRSASDQPV